MRRTPAAVAAIVAAVAVPALGVASAPGAGAQVAGACTTSDGVTVVIDFGALGGGVQVGCARGPQATGLSALTNAGFAWTGTTRFPSFVCRILDKPADANCYDAAPVNATWAYWTAAAGGEWTYSSVGAAGGATASPGTVQGWSWSTGRNVPPSISPPRLPVPDTVAPPAPAPTAVPNPVSPAQPANPAAGQGSAASGGAPAPGNSAAAGSAGGSPTGGSPAAAGAPATSVVVATPQPDPAVPAPADLQPGDPTEVAETEVLGAVTEVPETTVGARGDADDVASGAVTIAADSSAPIGTIVGATTVALGAAVAGLVARRRRRA